jgi:transcriptional regulator with XRE-family HTH domain
MKATKKTDRRDYVPAKRRTSLTPAQALRTVRELQELSQADLARASGIPQPTISAMENGRAAVGVERAKKLARALRVHPAVLVFADWRQDADDEPASARRARAV